MFKSSQEIRLSTTSSHGNAQQQYSQQHANRGESVSVFGKYMKTPDSDQYTTQPPQVFVAPELTDTSRVQLLHFPNGACKLKAEVNFIIKRNGVKGNFEVKLENPSGQFMYVTLKVVDPERIEVDFCLTEAGLYKVHIKCNSVPLPKSPYIIVAISGNEMDVEKGKMECRVPLFHSDASKVTHRGIGLNHITLNEKNEFIIDGSKAGNNILFVGIFGPKGQCDEVGVKHMGQNIYKVTYQVEDPGEYLLATKWGDDHVPGSPFTLSTI